MHQPHEIGVRLGLLERNVGLVLQNGEVESSGLEDSDLPHLAVELFLFSDDGPEALVVRRLSTPGFERLSRDVVAFDYRVQIRAPASLRHHARGQVLGEPDVLFLRLLPAGAFAFTPLRSRTRL
jgi:hypothetical protein